MSHNAYIDQIEQIEYGIESSKNIRLVSRVIPRVPPDLLVQELAQAGDTEGT